MTLRRVMIVGLLALMVVLGAGAITAAGRSGSASAEDTDGTPCAAQIDCAGGIAVSAGALLLLAMPATAAGLLAPAPTRRVVSLPDAPHSALLAGRLFRPPRAS